MRPWECIERVGLPSGGGTLTLMRRDGEYEIRLGSVSLMSSRRHATEDAFGAICCELAGAAPRVVLGGLGLGFTLAATLRGLPRSARVVVAELVPAVVRWCRGPAGGPAGHPLDDPRVSVHEGDVDELVRRPGEPWDVVALDVDNGPAALTTPTNAGLYSDRGLAALRRALVPDGAVAIWSPENDERFGRRLGRAGFHVEARRVAARGERAVVWIARRGPTAPSG